MSDASGRKSLLLVSFWLGLLLSIGCALLVAAPYAGGPFLTLESAIVPVVRACPPLCDGTEKNPTGYCPDPYTGPCTEYKCKQTNAMKKCEFQT